MMKSMFVILGVLLVQSTTFAAIQEDTRSFGDKINVFKGKKKREEEKAQSLGRIVIAQCDKLGSLKKGKKVDDRTRVLDCAQYTMYLLKGPDLNQDESYDHPILITTKTFTKKELTHLLGADPSKKKPAPSGNGPTMQTSGLPIPMPGGNPMGAVSQMADALASTGYDFTDIVILSADVQKALSKDAPRFFDLRADPTQPIPTQPSKKFDDIVDSIRKL